MNVLRSGLPLAALLALTLPTSAPAAAQSPDHPVGRISGSHMHTLLQKTVLRVNVLTVDLCFDDPTARRFTTIAARGRLTGASADSITHAALAGRLAVARVEFLRDIPLRDFLDGVGEDLRNAVAAGLVADSTYSAVTGGLPRWFAPLRQRGVRKGDVLVYEMQAEAVRMIYVSRDGQTLFDRTEPGRGRRNSPLAAWLAPGSPFRAGLLQSLQHDGARSGRGAAAPVRAAGCGVRA